MRWWCAAHPLLAGVEKLRQLLQKPKFKTYADHVHDAHCGCGHQHLPTQEQLQNGDDWRARLMIVLSMWECARVRERLWCCCSVR